LKKAPFLELFISSFKGIFPGKFEHAISLPTINYLQNSENLGQISFFIGEIFEEIKVVRFF
jgi:hypothetical protein